MAWTTLMDNTGDEFCLDSALVWTLNYLELKYD